MDAHETREPLEDFIDRMERAGYKVSFHKNSEDDRLFFTKVMEYLNDKKGGTPFHINYPSAASKLILALKRKGFTFEQISTVINIKCEEWKGTKMWIYFRWKTLFAETNFQNYIAQDGPGNKQTTTFQKFAASLSLPQGDVPADSAERK